MNQGDIVDQVGQPPSTATNCEAPFGGVRVAGAGRTIGDGMYATAKVTGTLGVLALLMKALPALCVCLGGCLLCLRGCLTSVAPPIAPATMRSTPQMSTIQSPSRLASPGVGRLESSQRRPARRLQRRAGRPTRSQDPPSFPDETLVDALNDSPITDSRDGDANETAWETAAEDEPPPENSWNLPRPSFSANVGENPDRLLGAIRDQASPKVQDDHPLFQAVGGRTFTGTSQQPGQPSARIKLTIDKIREAGQEITAHLSLMDRPRVRQAYTGLIEVEPLRLTLIPQRNPRDVGGVFLPYTSWQVGCPTTITLELSKDGQRLSGTSISGEEFELAPLTPLSLNIDDEETDEPLADPPGLSGLGNEPWTVFSRNGTALEKPTDCWTFEPTSDRSGRFRWTRNAELHAEGTYSAQPDPSRLTLRLKQGKSPRVFRMLIALDDAHPDTCRVCVAAAGAAWPKRLDRQFGTIFELRREP